MSDAPTFASLFARWSSGDAAARRAVYAHLRDHPAEAAALEAVLRDELGAALPAARVAAAEAVLEVYGDAAAAAAALTGVLQLGDPAAASDAAGVLRALPPAHAAAPLAALALHAPAVFCAQPRPLLRWAGAAAVLSGDAGAALWLDLLNRAAGESDAEAALLMGLADAAPRAAHDLSGLAAAVQSLQAEEPRGHAAACALWRITWRVNGPWLAALSLAPPAFEDESLLALVVEVLTEHLGRRRDLAPLVASMLGRLNERGALDELRAGVRRLARLGPRGWAALLPLMGDPDAPAFARAAAFEEAATRPAIFVLAQHHAHAVILARQSDGDLYDDLVRAAAGVLAAIGAPAGSALADVLDLIVKQPHAAPLVSAAVPALAPGCPNAAHAVARTLDRLRRSNYFRADAFAALAEVYAAMAPGSAPRLAEDTSFDPRTPDLLVQQPAWKAAAPEARRRDARALADLLASPRPDVRSRAAELLRHYADQLPAAWPALVAALAGADEKLALSVLPYFRHLAPAADAVANELLMLFREPNPAYAARAAVALWRVGRLGPVEDEFRAAVVGPPDGARGWAVLRGVIDRAGQAHGLLGELSRVFAAAPPEVAAKVEALVNPPEPADEAAIAAHLPPGGRDDGGEPPAVNWNGVYQHVSSDAEGGFLFLALMCAHGSQGFAAQKVWMIKHQRMLNLNGLAEAKGIVERAMDRLTATATAGDRRACVRDYFGNAPEPPKSLTDLLDHPFAWYRWAGLELLDAFGAPHRLPELLADRAHDRSALVRTRALRMLQG
jgi:hypothetical protein